MKSMYVLSTVLLLIWGGCGGKTSSGPSQNAVSFVNSTPKWTFTVEVPEAHQYFELNPGDRKTIPLISDEESVTDFVFTVTRKGTDISQTGVISIGQREVEISANVKDENFLVYIDGEELRS